MLAPYCEAESAEPVIRAAGIEGLALWRATYPGLVNAGTLVVAQPRDTPELKRFARMAPGHVEIDRERIATLEPDLASRFAAALYFADEAHMATPAALDALLGMVRAAGAAVTLGRPWCDDRGADIVVDCRGLGRTRGAADLARRARRAAARAGA